MDKEQQVRQQLIDAGRELYTRNMVPATSGNFSGRVAENSIAITVSGRHKGKLQRDDIMMVDLSGAPLEDKKPSAETLLHTQIYRLFPEVNFVLHPHSVYATLLSKMVRDNLVLENYELLKAFSGVETHETPVLIPVFQNDQNIPELALKVEKGVVEGKIVHGYLIEGHGFYTWGGGFEDAIRHVEAFEFLFECEWKRLSSL